MVNFVDVLRGSDLYNVRRRGAMFCGFQFHYTWLSEAAIVAASCGFSLRAALLELGFLSGCCSAAASDALALYSRWDLRRIWLSFLSRRGC